MKTRRPAKTDRRLAVRQAGHPAVKDKSGAHTLPGSRNPHKSASIRTGRRG